MDTTTRTTPPIAEERPHSYVAHGTEYTDPFAWLRDREDPGVIAYLEAENRYTEQMTGHLTELHEELYHDMVGRIRQTDMNVPVKIDDWYYYNRTEEGKEYSIYCRRHNSMSADEEILLDLNRVAEETSTGYVGVGVFEVSPDHTRLAYSLDLNGSEEYTLRIRNLMTGEYYPEQITGTYYSLVWGNDSRSFLYTVTDDAHRSWRILRHRLGEDVLSDRIVYTDEDALFRVGIGNTTDRRYGLIISSSTETSETHLLPLDDLDADLRVVEPRRTGLRYWFDHREGTFYIVTNDIAPDFRLVTAPAADPGRENWVEMLPERENTMIEGVQVFASFMALGIRMDGRKEIDIWRFDREEWETIEFSEESYVVYPAGNPVYDTDRLRFLYTSMTTPRTVYDYEVATGERHLMKQQEVLGEFNPADYRSERIFATAPDGEQVPISLVYRVDSFRNDGSNPALLYGYGSYGVVIDPTFMITTLGLLDRGFVYAIAHIRGGEDLGRRWYEEGKMKKKMTSFTDFIACGEHLVTQKYTAHERLAIMGGSAGGLLIGATINLAPGLAKAAVAQVPFVDVANTMLDETLPLTIGEYEEWGDPNDPEYFDYILSYSPYDNVREQSYPDLLVTAGLNDPRVHYWEPAKWVAKLRRYSTGSGPLLLKTHMGAGHGGASGRYEHLRERAFEYAFIIDRLSS